MTLRLCSLLASLAIGSLALTSCGGSTTVVSTPTYSNVTGDYVGTLTDATAGTMAAAVTLSEHGSAVGGALALGPAGAQSIALALAVASTNALTGSGTMDTLTVACTFTVSATYDPNANTLNGNYTPVSTCAGWTGGTFALTQQCMDAPSAARRTPKGLLAHC